MGFPAKSFYKIAQLAEEWACSTDDILHYGETGNLRIGIPQNGEVATVGILVEVSEGVVNRQPKEVVGLNGVFSLYPADIHKIALYGECDLQERAFVPYRKDINYVDLRNPIKVAANHLVVTDEEREKFVKRHGDIAHQKAFANNKAKLTHHYSAMFWKLPTEIALKLMLEEGCSKLHACKRTIEILGEMHTDHAKEFLDCYPISINTFRQRPELKKTG